MLAVKTHVSVALISAKRGTEDLLPSTPFAPDAPLRLDWGLEFAAWTG